MGRLNFIRNNQTELRSDSYKVVQEFLNSDANGDLSKIGKVTILPSTFSGGPRYMDQLFQDAMACIRVHGKPDLFITFTANPKCPEITQELAIGQEANDRPDLISRVFKLKLKALLNDLIEDQIFGKVVAHIYVIEFQKRGLPHAHILIVLDEADKIKTVQQVDLLVSAEIPDEKMHKLAYDTVTNCMMHGPCGAGFPNAPYMKDGKCSKGFPKEFQKETYLANDK